MAGIPSNQNVLAWFGGKGNIVWLNDKAKAAVLKYFDIISTGGKTPKQLYDAGQLCDGDILLGYQAFSHTNAYYGGGKSFDSGHTYATPKSGDGAKFSKWIGNLSCANSKVNYILRLKDRAYYRVQCGAFKDINVFRETVAKLNAAGYKTMQVVEDGLYKIQVGYFAGKTNAEVYAAKLVKKGFAAFVTEASSTPATEVTAETIQPSSQVVAEAPAPAETPVQTETTKTVYRVRLGIFTAEANAIKKQEQMKAKNYDTFRDKKEDGWHVYCGSFEKKAKASEKVAELAKKKIPATIEIVKI